VAARWWLKLPVSDTWERRRQAEKGGEKRRYSAQGSGGREFLAWRNRTGAENANPF
jgi:hypothetical protein